jgi:hypothetical protein
MKRRQGKLHEDARKIPDYRAKLEKVTAACRNKKGFFSIRSGAA